MIEAIQGAEIAAGPEDVSVASGQPDEALIRACQELIGLERRRIQQEADPMALPAVSALWEKNFRRALDCACSLPALTIEGQRARAEALQLIGGGVADDIEASPTERLSSALARDAMRAPTVSVRNVRVDGALVQACDAFVSALDERNRMRIERDANPSDGRRWADRHASLETRIEMLMQEIVSRRACGPEGRTAQMRALLAAQGPLRSFDELIAHAPDGFGRLVHVVLRDLAAEQSAQEVPDRDAASKCGDGADAVLVRLCGEFVQVMRAKDELMETDPASPEAQAVSDRARELLDDLLVQRATTPEGHKAQMEALAALGRPQMDYDRLIAEAPDWFGQVAAAILRDQAQVMRGGPAQVPAAASVDVLGPYEAVQRMRRAQRLKDQRTDAEDDLAGPTVIAQKRRLALDAAAAESVELALHDMLPLLPSVSLADAAVQVCAALETLRAVDLEPVGGSAPLYRSENVTRVVRCLSSALPVLMKASERDLSEVVDAVTLQMPDQEHGLFGQLWQGVEMPA